MGRHMQALLDHRTSGLSFYQRIAEAGGLMLSDSDDLEYSYQGNKRGM